MDFGLFYFASLDDKSEKNKYKLFLDSCEFADSNGFASVWIPERHFHDVGGLFPNPSVLGAALAMKTSLVEIRAGSVVLPLHDVIRVAEEWSVVDNLSEGRVSLSIASGWNANDFVFFPGDYNDRHAKMYGQIETLRELWRGESIDMVNGLGKPVSVKIFPKPVQKELPVWITAGGNDKTFTKAGEIGAHILTHLLGQETEELRAKIRLYRNALEQHGHAPSTRKVAVMLHTYVGDNIERVKNDVREPLKKYLLSHIGLKNIGNIKSMNLDEIDNEVVDELLELAFERYWNTAALIGTPGSCRKMVSYLREMGVTEIACLVDFGVDYEKVMNALHYLKQLKDGC